MGRDKLDAWLLDRAAAAGAQVFQPATTEFVEARGAQHVCRVHLPGGDGAAEFSAPLVIAAHGSWGGGSLPSSVAGGKPRPGDLFGFKAHFLGASLPADLMPLLCFPGGYGGMVHSDEGRVSLSCCIRRDRLAALDRSAGQSAGAAVLEHILASTPAVAQVLGSATLADHWLAAGPIRPGIRWRCRGPDLSRGQRGRRGPSRGRRGHQHGSAIRDACRGLLAPGRAARRMPRRSITPAAAMPRSGNGSLRRACARPQSSRIGPCARRWSTPDCRCCAYVAGAAHLGCLSQRQIKTLPIHSPGSESMSLAILGLGTALPPHPMSQTQAVELAQHMYCQTEAQGRLLQALFRKAGVNNRYTFQPHEVALGWNSAAGENGTGTRTLTHGPSTNDRMQWYADHAPPLALRASHDALERAELPPRDITHLVTVSCTGFMAPGIDLHLIRKLGLPGTVERVHVGFMGCHGGAERFARGPRPGGRRPGRGVLLCAVELCTLHFCSFWDPNRSVGNAIFGDGAAALVAGDCDGEGDWTVAACGSCERHLTPFGLSQPWWAS